MVLASFSVLRLSRLRIDFPAGAGISLSPMDFNQLFGIFWRSDILGKSVGSYRS